MLFFFFFQAEDGIRDDLVTGVRRVLFRSLALIHEQFPLPSSTNCGRGNCSCKSARPTTTGLRLVAPACPGAYCCCITCSLSVSENHMSRRLRASSAVVGQRPACRSGVGLPDAHVPSSGHHPAHPFHPP